MFAVSSKTVFKPWFSIPFIILTFGLSQVLAGSVVIGYAWLSGWSSAETDTWLKDSVPAQFVYTLLAYGCLLASVLTLLKLAKVPLSTIGLKRPRWADLGFGVIAFPPYLIGVILILIGAQLIFPALDLEQEQQIGFEAARGISLLVLTFLSLAVIPPIVEEILMRGYIYTGLKENWPTGVATVVTSLLFAAGHLQYGSGAPLLWSAGIFTFVLSLVLIYLRVKTGRLWASIVLHSVNNSYSFVLLFIVAA